MAIQFLNNQYISGTLEVAGATTFDTVANPGSDTDKFVVINGSGLLGFRTGAEILADIGAASSATSVTSVSGTQPIISSGGLTPTISLNYTGANNLIESATDLEGNSIATADSIIYNDATDGNVKKGLISDLPFSNTSGTVTSITPGADSGTGTAITTSGTITVAGGSNITTSVSGTTITVNTDFNQYGWSITDGSTTNSIPSGTTVTFQGGTGINTSLNGYILDIEIDSSVVPGGSGTAGKLTKWTATKTLGDGPVTISGSDATFDGHITLASDKKVNFGASSYIEGATSGSKLMFRSSDDMVFQPGNSTKVTFQANGNTTFAGTIGSGAITSTSAVTGTRLVANGTGNAIELNQSTTGSATYYVMDNTVETGGKRYRFGYSGGSSDKGSFSIYNQTDSLMPLLLSGANATFAGKVQVGTISSGTLNENTGVKLAIIGDSGDNNDGLIITRDSGSQNQLDQFINIYNDGTSTFVASGGTSTHGSFDFKSTNDKGDTSVSRLSIDASGDATFAGLVSGITPVNAANFVTKAYADGLTPGVGVFLPLAGGTMTGDIILGDNVKLELGAASGGDLQIYHDGSDSIIADAGTGGLKIQVAGTGTSGFYKYNTTEVIALFEPDGPVSLYHNNSKKFETTSAGVEITGDGTFTGTILSGSTDSIRKSVNDSVMTISGGNATNVGANYSLFGGTHTSLSNIHRWRIGGSEAMRLDSSGRLGINETSLTEKLEVDGAIVWKGALTTSKTSAGVLDRSGDSLRIRAYGATAGSGNLHFRTGGGAAQADTLALTLDSSQNATFAGTVSGTTATFTTFSGDLNGTINTATTAVTKGNAVNDTTVATTAFVQNVIGTIPAGLVFQGTWNASTNTPTLASGTGTTGHFYIVSVAGSTNLDGVTDWEVGDWAVFIEQGASDQWEKIDNSSVLGGSGSGGSLAAWAGSGTSVTLTNAPVTYSGNDTTFAGQVLCDTNTTTPTSGDAAFYKSSAGAVLSGYQAILETGSAGSRATALTINNSQNATFAGAVTLSSTSPLLYLNNTTSSTGKNWRFSSASNGKFYITHESVIDAVTLDHTTGNATFAGNVSAGGGTFTQAGGGVKVLNNGTAGYNANIFFGKSGGTDGYSIGQGVTANDGVFRVYNNGTASVPLAIADNNDATFAGNVGIGNAATNTSLYTKQTDASEWVAQFINTGTSSYGVSIDTTANTGVYNLACYTNTGTGLFVKNDGNVGIGTASPISGMKLDVQGGDFRVGDDANQGFEAGWSSGGGVVFLQGYNRGTSSFLDMSINNTVRITSGGNVGIGDTTPSFPLVVSKSSSNTTNSGDGSMRLSLINPDQTNNNYALITFSDGTTQPGSGFMGMQFTDHTNNYGELSFGTRGAGGYGEKMRIDSDGNVGIGTTSPTLSKLVISGGTTGSVGGGDAGITMINKFDNPDNSWSILPVITGVSNTGFSVRDNTDSADRLVIDGSGNVGIGVTDMQGKLNVGGDPTGDSAIYIYGSRGAADNLAAGHLTFRNVANGVGDVNLTRIQSLTGTGSNQTQKGQLTFSTNDGSSLTERMRIDSSGNVGIGTNNPGNVRLFVENTSASTNPVFKTKLDTTYSMGMSNEWVSQYVSKIKIGRLSSPTSSMDFIYDIAGTEYGSIKRNYTASSLKFERGTTVDMIINGTGNVGIGTTSPSVALDVTGEISASDDINTTGKFFAFAAGAELRLKSTSDTGESYINFADPSDNNVGQIFYGHSDNRMIFRVNDDERMRITSDGMVGIGMTPGTAGSSTYMLQMYNPGSQCFLSIGNGTSGNGPVNGLVVGNDAANAYIINREATTLNLGCSDSVDMVILSGGNVGIGTTSPTAWNSGRVLHIHNPSGNSSELHLTDNGSGAASGDGSVIHHNSTNLYVQNHEAGSTFFYNNGSANMIILAGGDVGIGTTNPQRRLSLYQGDSGSSYAQFINTTTGSNAGDGLLVGIESDERAMFWNHENTDMVFATNNDTKLTIAAGGNVGIGTTSPLALLNIEGPNNQDVNDYAQLYIKGTGTYPDDIAGIVLDSVGSHQSHIRFSNNGSPKFQLRYNEGGNTVDKLMFYSWTQTNDMMTLDGATGNVGIGTTTPTNPLSVEASNASDWVAEFKQGHSTAGQSYGVNIFGGTNSSDAAFQVCNQAGSGLLRVNGAGNVGIGTSSPSAKLEIVTAVGADAIRMNYGQSADIFLGFSSANPRILLQDNSNVITHNFVSNGDNYIVGSNVGIGTTAPANLFSVSASGTVTTRYTSSDTGAFSLLEFENSGSIVFSADHGNTQSNSDIIFKSDGASERMRIGSSGATFTGNVSNTSGQILPNELSMGDNKKILVGNGDDLQIYHDSSNSYMENSTGNLVLKTANAMSFWTAGTKRLQINSSGSVAITGALSKGSGSFRINHPLEAKKDTHQLVHSFVEGPQADNIYRGKINLVDGKATVNIDTEAGMTEGTFVVLNTNIQCFTTNESNWDLVKGSVSENILTIESKNTSSTATISWLVIGERHDQHMKDTDWTDDNGKVIVEPTI